MKKVLTIHYSQSGQLTEIVQNFSNELTNVDCEHVIIKPKSPFPFPWKTDVFFDIMPDCVLEKPHELEPFELKHDQYDLIIFAYQPWFLSPSIPATSLLKHEKFKTILKDTPVVTLIGSRNMWLNSQESVKKLIKESKGILVGNIALEDKTSNLISVITILHWMLTGKKTKKWGIFPKPGVSDEDIKNVSIYGKLLNDHLHSNQLNSYQDSVIKNKGVSIKTGILFIEGKAKKIFNIWAGLIEKKTANGKRRTFWVNAFKYYLLFVLFIVSPILLIFYYIFILPFTMASVIRKKRYFMGVDYNN